MRGKKKDKKKDMINPTHYKTPSGMEVIDVIEAFGLWKDFYLSNATKYILRCGKKDDPEQEIEKAIWYLQRKLRNLRTL